VSFQQLTDILQRLVEEEVPIRDLKSIFQALSKWAPSGQDSISLTEHVRAALKEKICYQLSEGKPALYVYQLDPEIEEMVRTSIRQGGSGAYLAMEPAMIQQVIDAAYAQIGQLPPTAQKPVILTDSDIRRFVKRLLEYSFPELSVLSYDQLSGQVNAYPLGVISLVQPGQLADQKREQLGAGA
jgi:type III secretion protein V